MKNIIAILLLLSFGAHAQQKINRCASHDIVVNRNNQEPGFAQRMNDRFDYLKSIATENKAIRAGEDTLYRIRCVFHVVYTAPEENIPDSVIFSQIEVLNECYRRTNADTVVTREVFKPFAADTKIEFYLATEDPDGNPTTGITRTVGSPTGFLGFTPFGDEVKADATGGKDAWPTDRYMNIWVCNVLNGFGILGYAFPPVDAPNWPANSTADSAKEGVVLHYPVVGRNFSAPIDPSVAAGKSAVHEVGHYLGLRHIWGDGDCTEDDGLADTPDAADANQQTCDTTLNTCSESPIEYPDMIENYMDYSDDRCLNMFTNDQIGIMRASLQGSRRGIRDALVISNVKTVDNIAGLQVFPNPTTGQVMMTWTEQQLNNAAIEVYNAMGSLITHIDGIQSNKAIIDLSSFSNGVYFAKLKGDNKVAVQKIHLVR